MTKWSFCGFYILILICWLVLRHVDPWGTVPTAQISSQIRQRQGQKRKRTFAGGIVCRGRRLALALAWAHTFGNPSCMYTRVSCRRKSGYNKVSLQRHRTVGVG